MSVFSAGNNSDYQFNSFRIRHLDDLGSHFRFQKLYFIQQALFKCNQPVFSFYSSSISDRHAANIGVSRLFNRNRNWGFCISTSFICIWVYRRRRRKVDPCGTALGRSGVFSKIYFNNNSVRRNCRNLNNML